MMPTPYRSLRFQAFRLETKHGEKKTRFVEQEVEAWKWLMLWPDRPQLEEVPAKFREAAMQAMVHRMQMTSKGNDKLLATKCQQAG